MNAKDSILVFTLDEQRYALALSVVERVFPMVEITPLPKAPDIVQGIINLHGSPIPVYNIRRRFGIPVWEYEISDQLIIVHTNNRRVALPVDTVQGVVEPAGKPVETSDILPSLPYIKGVVKLPDGLILIHDPDTFLSLDEEAVLDEALPAGGT
jgi:purine-binding chemotaxis protein CheW